MAGDGAFLASNASYVNYENYMLVSELKHKHLISDTPRVMVVDGSKLVRQLITNVLQRELPEVDVIGCTSIAEAQQTLDAGAVHLVTTSLFLPDGDGLALARSVREVSGQAYVPVIVVSGDTQQHLVERRFTEYVTDYFDKALGYGHWPPSYVVMCSLSQYPEAQCCMWKIVAWLLRRLHVCLSVRV